MATAATRIGPSRVVTNLGPQIRKTLIWASKLFYIFFHNVYLYLYSKKNEVLTKTWLTFFPLSRASALPTPRGRASAFPEHPLLRLSTGSWLKFSATRAAVGGYGTYDCYLVFGCI
jgi:hypothetical protein